MQDQISKKQLFVFDLDGTLAESKTPMDAEMAGLLEELLKKRRVAVIGGGRVELFETQLLANLEHAKSFFDHLFLFPTSGTRFLRYEDGWKTVYAHELSEQERTEIKTAFEKAFQDINYRHPETTYGEVIEDRGTQVTFSALGQQAPIDLKNAYTGSVQDRRQEIVRALYQYIPQYEIKIPGKTSIDVTMKGIDKGYGVEQMRTHLGVPIEEMVFVGDALYEGGNDEPVKRTGIETYAVTGPEETKKLLREWLLRL